MNPQSTASTSGSRQIEQKISGPLALIAEVTHRCPLHCVYCSNPLEMEARAAELSTEQWTEIFRQAAVMGVLQLDLTGGEPIARADIVELVGAGRAAGLYINLITSGIGLNAQRLEALVAAGLDHVQLSFQDSQQATADEFAGTRAHARKLELARHIKNQRVGFTVNMVVHRQNLDRLAEMLTLAEELGPDKLEIANVQYYGWALKNQAALLPTRAQLDRSVELVKQAQQRLKGRMKIDFVVPDYYGVHPKPCMGGWGRKLMLINPAGDVLPCHAAGVIPGMKFDNVKNHELRWIWEESSAFRRFRGEDWMPEPCRSCDRRELDFGGCRCQAFLLTGDPSATDPTCELAPAHSQVTQIVAEVNRNGSHQPSKTDLVPPEWIYRPNP